MSEYLNVEHPFLEKLREIGWKVIDKGSGEGEGAGEIWEGKEGVDGKVVEQKWYNHERNIWKWFV